MNGSPRIVGTILLVGALAVPSAFGQAGDVPVAERFLARAVAAGDWKGAEAVLERGLDFADVASDLPYLLAVVRSRLERPAGSVLAAVRLSLASDRWLRYRPEAARLVEAETLIRVRDFRAALAAAAGAPPSADRAYAELRSWAGSADWRRYFAGQRRALADYPADPRFPRLLFDLAARRTEASAEESALIDTARRRLDAYLAEAPDLLWRSAPFAADPAERVRLVAAYRAVGGADPEALVAAVDLGLVDGAAAAAEFFARPSGAALDLGLARRLWALLRDDPARAAFAREAETYAGWINADADGDGRAETFCRYAAAELVECGYDADQDGLPEIAAAFSASAPVSARIAVPAPEPSAAAAGEGGLMAVPASEAERGFCSVAWARYPYVSEATLAGSRYEPAPAAFPYAPLVLEALVAGAGAPRLYFAQAAFAETRLTERSLWSFASVVERPGRQAEGSVERLEVTGGVVRSSVESLNGVVIARRQYVLGRLAAAQLDLDVDGRLETTVRYLAGGPDLPETVALRESDWDGDGRPEFGERRLDDGRTERSWDMDGDGRRERTLLVP
jgi:hypothetical protein